MKTKPIIYLILSGALVSITAQAQLGKWIKELPLPGGNKPQQPVANSPASNVNLSSPVDELAKKDVAKCQTIGAMLGAVAGGVAGHYAGKELTDDKNVRVLTTGVGAVVGGKVGSSLGEQIGQVAANRRKQYNTEQQFLESEIAASEKAIAVRQAELDNTNAEIERTHARIAELNAKASLTQKEKAEVQTLKNNIKEEITKNKLLAEQYDEKIAYLKSVLETSKVEANATAEEKESWERKHASLTAKMNDLNAQRTTTAEQGSQLAGSQKLLENMKTS